MTAAHKTLPFGSTVKVTNKKTGHAVTVTITDRGPYVKGRCIDLTTAGARGLGLAGLAPVSVVPVVSEQWSMKRYVGHRSIFLNGESGPRRPNISRTCIGTLARGHLEQCSRAQVRIRSCCRLSSGLLFSAHCFPLVPRL